MSYPLISACWMADCEPSEKLVLLCLAFHARPGGGNAYPSVRRMASLTGLASSTVQNCLAQLIGRGYVSITRRGHQSAANVYALSIAALAEHPVSGVPLTGAQPVLVTDTPCVDDEHTPLYRPSAQLYRSTPEGVPTTGTEQSTTLSLPGEREAHTIWKQARQALADALGFQVWDTWLRPLTPAGWDGHTLTLSAANPAIASTAAQYAAALASTLNVRKVQVTCTASAAEELSPASQNSVPLGPRHTHSRPSAKRWQRSA